MKLTDLEAQFHRLTLNDGIEYVDELADAQGVMFLCPLGHDHMVDVLFRNRGVPDAATPGPGRWDVSGANLSDLTLSPSVHLPGVGCGWHGWIRNGEVISC